VRAAQSVLRVLLAVAVLGTLVSSPAAAQSVAGAIATSPGILAVSGNGFVLDGQPFVMKGFNYFPRDFGWSSMTDWDWTEVDQEMALANSLGANTIRVMIDYGYSTGHPDEIWSQDDEQKFQKPTPAYLDAMQQLLVVADSHGLKVVFCLFDYMPSWAFIDRADYPTASNYLAALVPAFAGDPRIAAWSVHNEGDLIAEKFPAVGLDKVIQFYAAMAAKIRSVDSQHLITADFGRIWNAHLAQDFVDYTSFHYYDDPAVLPREIAALRGRLTRPMPIVAGELGRASDGNQWSTTATQTVALGGYLDTALRGDAPLAGALVWLLMDQNTPKTDLNRQRDKGSFKFGMYDGNLQPKPAAAVVQQYFSGGCGPGQRIELRFPNAPTTPLANSQRDLQVGVRDVTLLRSDGSPISHVQFGTPEANLLEGRGWFDNETWGQWAGAPDRTASLCMVVPEDAQALSIQAQSVQPDIELQVWYLGVLRGSVVLQPTPSEHVVSLVDRG
jgi:Cellulase (glycosyl hydrolase family 5)